MPVLVAIATTVATALASKGVSELTGERIHASDIKSVNRGNVEIRKYTSDIKSKTEALANEKISTNKLIYLLPLISLLVPLSLYLITRKK